MDPILAKGVEVTIAELDRKIKRAYPEVQRIFIEIEPWRAKDAIREGEKSSDTPTANP